MKIPILAAGVNERSVTEIQDCLRDEAAVSGPAEIIFKSVRMTEAVRNECYNLSAFQIVIVDVCVPGGILYARKVRELNKGIIILIIADMGIPPMDYMNSAIRAESLLIKPWNATVLQKVMNDVLDLCFQRRDDEDSNRTFLLENSDGKTLIPYRDIYYFEARNKRIYIRTRNQEYGTYGTLEKLKELLPEYYVQCHRSYIINKRNILTVKFSKNTIFMHNHIIVPLSRTYKDGLREIVHEAGHK